MIAEVALPIPIGKPFSYSVPAQLSPFIATHMRVTVPFHNREMVGVVIALREGEDTRLKSISDIIDLFPLTGHELPALIEWSSSHYITPPGLVFKYALPPFKNVERFLVIEAKEGDLQELDGLSFKKASREIGKRLLVRHLNEGSISLRDSLTGHTFSPATDGPFPGTPAGKGENTLLTDSVENRFERYVSLISKHILNGQNVMFLLPDYYAAGSFFAKRLKEVYGSKVLWYASGVKPSQKMETFFKARSEGGNLILGNKSCVFLPVRDLALIIVERPEDDEYRNEEGFKFNAVRLAIERARLRDATIILGSASCPVDLFHLAGTGSLATNASEWILSGRYPEKTLKKGSSSTGEVIDAILFEARQTVQSGTRLVIYTPRKEHGGFLKCHGCGQSLTCRDCGDTLIYNKERDAMLCPNCRQQSPYDDTCPACGSNMIGFSRISTEFIDECLRRDFPYLKVICITGDSLKKEISMVRKLPPAGPIVLVGTQSLSKLYGFKADKLILAGWEELRKMGGHRSEEKAHQIVANLLDALTPGEIQFLSARKKVPDPGDYFNISSFCDGELKKRREADFPPFSRVFLVQIRKKTALSADTALRKVKKIISEEGLESFLFGTLPVKRPPYHIWKVILRGEEQLLRNAFQKLYDIPGVELEADPLSF